MLFLWIQVPEGVYYPVHGICVIQSGLKKSYQHECGKAGSKGGIDMVIGLYENRS